MQDTTAKNKHIKAKNSRSLQSLSLSFTPKRKWILDVFEGYKPRNFKEITDVDKLRFLVDLYEENFSTNRNLITELITKITTGDNSEFAEYIEYNEQQIQASNSINKDSKKAEEIVVVEASNDILTDSMLMECKRIARNEWNKLNQTIKTISLTWKDFDIKDKFIAIKNEINLSNVNLLLLLLKLATNLGR